MTKEDVAKILAFITATYPQTNIKQGTVEAWHELLKDLGFHLAFLAVKRVLCESEFPCLPSIGEIRRAAYEISQGRGLDFDEAWLHLSEAIRRFGFYDEEGAMAFLGPELSVVARNIGWREICLCEEPDVLRGQFRRIWETMQRRRERMWILPPEMRNLEAIRGERSLPKAQGESDPTPMGDIFSDIFGGDF